MNIHRIRTLAGPNIYSHRPMLAMELDLGNLYAVDSCELPDFIDRLLVLLPGLHDHHCASGKPGGFIRRLREGTYFGHIVEHVALELTDAVGISTTRGKTVSTELPGRYLVAVEYQSEAGMKHLLETAVGLVDALVRDEPYPLEARLEEARSIVDRTSLGPSTKAIVEAATARGIAWTRVNDDSRIRLGTGRAIRHVEATMTDRTSIIAVDLAGNKHETKRVLREVGLPVPDGRVVSTVDEAIEALTELAPPVVTKPLDSNQGKGVSLNLRTPDQVREAFQLAAAVSRRVIVEQMLTGNDYRVVIVNGRMVAAAQRIPAHVRGDGRLTIRQLIDVANHDPRRGNGHEKPMTKIHTDPLVLAILKRQGRVLDDVPEAGELVLLRESANLSTGGEARDVTDRVHASVRSLCERAVRAIGLDVCGVDLVVPDIEQPFASGGIVELNAAPGIRMHHHPAEGEPRDVGAAIVDMLYPDGAATRIPVIAITGTNGKTTVTRMIAHAARETGYRVGMTTTDGIWIGPDAVAEGDLTGPWSANVVLSDSSVDIAVLETARGGIIKSGLGYDWADVAVITNIQLDHVGQDGIENIEDIARIKRLVAERVREGGTLVLNADDEQVTAFATHPRVTAVPKSVVYFSQSALNPVVRQHVLRGGTAYVANGGWIEEQGAGGITRLTQIDLLPSTLSGTANFQVANVLAAAAGALSAGMPREAVVRALVSFDLRAHNPGRLNTFSIGGGHVIVDYGHNPAAIKALCDTVAKWDCDAITVVLGVPGDRRDDLIRAAARAASGVDRLILREDDDPRGRARGDVAEIMRRVLAEESPSLPVDVVLNELESVDAAVQRLTAGAIAIILADDVAGVIQRLQGHGATAAAFQPPRRAVAKQPAA
ncbi:MAG TPA: cyanophycin synthetase [Vicinamibacterales bacterium]|nr:cyanophycin synthetase [Vicinamibacterales bacterium]